MVDMSMIVGAVGSLKSAVDIAKAVKEINDLQAVRDRVIEMQDLIMGAQASAVAAQSQLMEMIQEISELKSKLSAVEEWKATAARYQLRDFGGGTFAYELKPEAAEGEPIHLACPVCFQQRKRTILQFRYDTNNHQKKYHCGVCNTDLDLGNRRQSSPPVVTRERPGGWST